MSPMSRSSQGRPGFWSRMARRWRDRVRTPGALARSAGEAPRFGVEALEARQLLFAVTITADAVDPNTGIGTAEVAFVYGIQPLITPRVTQTQPTVTNLDQDFNQIPLGIVASQTFLGNQIKVVHNLAPATSLRVVQNGQTDQERGLRVNTPNSAQFYQFELFGTGQVYHTTAQSLSFSVTGDTELGNDATGLLPSRTRVQMFYNGALIQTIEGPALLAAVGGNVNGVGVFNLVCNVPGGFDTIRIETTAPAGAGDNPAYVVDNLRFGIRSTTFTQDQIIAYAVATISGPVGASAELFDLYGISMRNTLTGGVVDGTDRAVIDLNDDGIYDFNNGIGSIRFTGVDSRTAFSIIGLNGEITTTRPQNADFFDGRTAGTFFDNVSGGGEYDRWEQGGFGFVADFRQPQQRRFAGLPTGPGSVMIGSPWVRPLNNYNLRALPPGITQQQAASGITAGFNRADQGIFIDGGQSIGSITINGMLFGSSRITGFADRVYVGYMLGTMTVKGDVGQFVVGTDSGSWSPDTGFATGQQLNAIYPVSSALSFERTVGEIYVGGRLLSAVTVLGDVNSPTTRPARDVYTYYEREFVFGFDPATQDGAREVMRRQRNNTAYVARQPSQRFRTIDMGVVVGEGFDRNDSLLGAEFIGSGATGVRIVGDLSGRDPTQGEDAADVYAFAVDGTRDVYFESTGTVGNMRILNQRGETVASPRLSAQLQQVGQVNAQMRFHPSGPGVYYLVLTDGNFADNGFTNSGYSVNVSGLSPLTLGQLRIGAAMGYGSSGAAVTVLAGDVGSVRVGSGVTTPGGDITLSTFNIFGGGDAGAVTSMMAGTISIPGNLYTLVAGSDIGTDPSISGVAGSGTIVLTVGGNFGTLWTGQQTPGSNAQGDLNLISILVGGSIGELNIQGGVGLDQDPQNSNRRAGVGGPGSVIVRTGTAGGRGDIGFIRTGFHVVGDVMQVYTSPGSTIGGLFVAEDAYGDGDPRTGIYLGQEGIRIRTGVGSDVRFVDTPRIDVAASVQVSTPLFNNVPVQVVDDGGTIVTITVSGGADGVLAGQIRSLRIDGSVGSAIGAIEVDLSGGRTLNITATGTGVASIGTIDAAGRRAGSLGLSDATSQIVISGNTEIDVYRIIATAMDAITNSTPGGDIVCVDVGSLNTISVTQGDLGRTQVPSWGRQRIGMDLGLAADLQGGLLNPLGAVLTAGVLADNDFNGNIYRPINDDSNQTGNAYLDDIGGPMDGQLNGLVVRTGNVQSVTVSGSVGDVILQGDGAILLALRADSDGRNALGAFDGIVGTIYAGNIADVDVGMGLAAADESPLCTTGIFAANDILRVRSTRSGAVISSVINAANATNDAIPGVTDGITDITFTSGRFSGAYIGAMQTDAFWISLMYGEDNVSRGTITTIGGTATNMFRTVVRGRDLTTMNLGGVFDASTIALTGSAGAISVGSARNSTLAGSELEFVVNQISIAGNLQTLTAAGDLNDLYVDIVGLVSGSITAQNINRSRIDVTNDAGSIIARTGIHGTSINVGRLATLRATESVDSSSIAVSGPFTLFDGGKRITNTRVEISGPAGALGTMRARDLVTGEIESAGPVTAVTSDTGDVDLRIITTTSRGNVGTLTAGRDVRVRGDISGNLASINATRSIGSASRKDVILVRGDLAQATARTGQLYADLRVGGQITGTVTIGQVINKPGNSLLGTGSVIAFGRINSVVVTGDFGGDIISYSGGIGNVSITNGSFLPGRTIAAYSGDLTSLAITNGNLYGDVHADFDLKSIRVTAAADGVFGDIGVNPEHNQFTGYDGFRNRLPAGVAQDLGIQGPRISAGRDIVSVTVSGGSVFETTFSAGLAIKNVTIAGDVRNDDRTAGPGSAFVAGNSIDAVTINGSVADTLFLAGVTDLGEDGRAGGTGVNADTVRSGSIARIAVRGAIRDSQALAGVQPGADGVYGTADDRAAIGNSSINVLTAGSVTNSRVAADTLATALANDARFARDTSVAQGDAGVLPAGSTPSGARVTSGQAVAYGGGTVTFTVAGAGEIWFDAGASRVTLRGTTTSTSVTIASTLSSLADFIILSTNGSALSTLRITPALTGTSTIVVDGNVGTFDLPAYSGTGRVTIGGDVTSATFAAFTGGSFSARNVSALTVTGEFGSSGATRPRIDLLSAGSLTFRGAARGIVSVERNATTLAVQGFAEQAGFRFGGNLGTFTAPTIRQTILSVGRSLTTATINGDVVDSYLMAGADLGQDAAFGGTGVNADRVTSASIGTITVNGNFQRSDVIASYIRGADGFFGTTDDTVAPGLSTIGTVTIRGSSVGSTRNSESFRVASSGTIGTVTVGGTALTGATGNFGVEALGGTLAPVSIVVDRVDVTSSGGVFTARLKFNQPIDASTIRPALSVSEVRGTGNVTIRLVEGADYVLNYDPSSNTALITFSRSVTERNLPQVPGRPGPGVYRFELDQRLFRGKSLDSKVDGNGDGFSTPGDNYATQAFVGDPGDKLVPNVLNLGAGATATRVDLYGPANLDLVMDSITNGDGLPDANTPYTVRGVLGDHPDHDVNNFPPAGDTDLYSITLQAGQILRLSGLRGEAINAGFLVIDPSGNALARLTANGQNFQNLDAQAAALELPTQFRTSGQFVAPLAYLIRQTGRYTIVVGSNGNPSDNTTVPVVAAVPGSIGQYNFDVEVFDDGDSGFTSNIGSGDGTNIVNAPSPSVFAGLDQVLGTADDLTSVTIGSFTFTLSKGADNTLGTADDVVTGTNGSGITSTRIGGTLTSTVQASIGPAGHFGVPTDVTSDVDIFHLNNRTPIAPGTRMKITVKLAQTGADLGSPSGVGFDLGPGVFPPDRRGSVQFGLFDTSASTSVDDASLVFSPTDFTPIGGTPNTVLADNGTTKYGFDANGDYYIEFVVPDRVGSPGQAGTFAAYVQGVYNNDYTLEVVTSGTGTITRQTQNFVIETNGGTINWLQAGGQTTTLSPFTARVLGFTGTISGQSTDQYVVAQAVTKLNTLFANAGLNVRFSSNPADFQFQPFSTIYLSSNIDPLTSLFASFDLVAQGGFGGAGNNPLFFSTQPFGFSQHSDPFNANLRDEAVVFAPSFGLLGLNSSRADVDVFVDALTGAIGRRAGELMGLRASGDDTQTGLSAFDPMAANSVEVTTGTPRTFGLSNANRRLSSPYDSRTNSDFFLGGQRATSLLEKWIAAR